MYRSEWKHLRQLALKAPWEQADLEQGVHLNEEVCI